MALPRTSAARALVVLVGIGVAAAVLWAQPPTLDDWIDQLADDDPKERDAAIEAIVREGPRNLPRLLDEIDSPRPLVTKAALAVAIQKIGIDAETADDVEALLTGRDPAAREAAIAILATSPGLGKEGLSALLSRSSELGVLREGAATALSQSPDTGGSLDPVASNLTGPEAVRLAAIRGLARTGSDGVKAVGKIAADATRPRADRRAALAALSEKGVQSHDVLVGLAQAPAAWVRAEATSALADQGSAQDASRFSTWTKDAVADVRFQALRGLLAAGGGGTYRETVIGLLADADVRVLATAVQFLGPNGADIARRLKPTLTALLAAASFEVRYEAALALFAHGDKAGGPVMQADMATPSLSQAARAKAAYDRINGTRK